MKTNSQRICARSQRGEGRLKAIFWTALLIILVFVAFKTVPAYVNQYQLLDKMQETARFASVNRQTDEQIRETIFKEIQDLEIPARREDIKIQNTGREVRIDLNYSVPVDFMVYKTDLHFSANTANKSIL